MTPPTLTNEQAHEAFDDASAQEVSFRQEEFRATSHDAKARAHQQRWAWLDVMARAAALHDAAVCARCHEARLRVLWSARV